VELTFARNSDYRCSTKTKSTAYTTLLRSVLDYASPVWGPQQITTTRDIEQVQRRAARFAYRLVELTFARNSDYNAFFRMETHLPFSLPFF
jgi:hypothetical protein